MSNEKRRRLRERAQETLEAFDAHSRGEGHGIAPTRQEAKSAAETLDDMDDRETIENRSEGVRMEDLETQDVDELAEELGISLKDQR